MEAFKGFGKNSGPAVPPKSLTPFGHFAFPPPDSHLQRSPSAPSCSNLLFDNHSQLAPPGRRSPPLPFLSNQSTVDAYHPAYDSQRPSSFLDVWGNQSKSTSDNSRSNRRSRSPVDAADIPASKLSRSQYLSSTDEVSLKSSHDKQQDSERRSLSPPRLNAGKNVPRSPVFLSPNLPLAALGMSSDNGIDKSADYRLTKRTKPPPSPANQTFQENSYPTLDGTEREIQAKAKRLVRFKAELSDPVEQSPNFAKQNIASIRSHQFVAVKQKHASDYSAGATRDLADDFDNDGGKSPDIIVGLCPDMCPESERAERERKGDLDQYERLDGDRNQTSKALAVKKYTRTAEREADLIRPLPILQKTMGYLLNLLDQHYDDSFLGLYNFLWDRMRAVRMDLRMQHIFNFEAITMLEQMIRLHIIAMHELCEYTKGEGFSEGFDAHLNIEQMNKTSVELFQLYDDHRKKGVYVPTEEEFRGYYALLKLDKHPGYKVEPAELSLDLAKMTSEIRQTQEVLFAREVARSCRTGNFIAFFRLAGKATYLQACLMHAHFSKLRTLALASLHSGLQINQGLPVVHVAMWLGMEGEDIESLLEYHGFSIKEFEEPYMVKEGTFLNSDQDYPTHCSKLVHSKKSEMIVDDVLSSTQALTSPFVNATKLDPAHVTEDKLAGLQSGATEKSLIVRDEEMTDSRVSSPRDLMQLLPRNAEHGRIDSPGAAESSPRGIRQAQPALPVSSNHQPAWVDSPRAVASSPRGIRQVQPAFTISDNYLHGRFEQRRAISSSSKGTRTVKPAFLTSNNYHHDDGPQSTTKSITPVNFNIPKFVFGTQQTILEWEPAHTPNVLVETSPENDRCSGIKAAAPDTKSRTVEQERQTALFDSLVKSSLYTDSMVEEFGDKEPTEVPIVEDEVVPVGYDKEVAEAKLKFFIRLWRRWYLRRRELREQNKVAAASALNSLSLGPPIRQNNNIWISYGKFNIDQVAHMRLEKHEQSWSRLNVSDVVADKLTKINASVNCICWKVVLWSPLNPRGNERGQRNQVNSFSEFEWLHSKLMPSGERDDSLLVSSPGLSIWRKWISKCGTSTCCLSVVKDAKFGESRENLLGACALLYSLSISIPWEAQKIQLHNLVASLPPESHLPLLIISSFNEQESSDTSSTVYDKLGLNGIDRSRIGNFLIISLHADGYFSDQRLRKGLEWLATNSPSQAILYHVKTLELVHTYLDSSLDVLEQMDKQRISPEKCVSLFNEALDRSLEDVISAANGNTHGWPCPELSLIDKFSEEHRAVSLLLPAIGWSSAERVQPLISALTQCKLPDFCEDISWLARGSNVGEDIEDQRLSLQKCLVRYLVLSSKLMSTTLAAKEADIMVQNCTRLELHGTRYYLVPSWVRIFRRVFNWRLNILASGASAGAYVLENHPASSPPILQNTELENNPSLHYRSEYPSLDEMIEVSCSPFFSKRARPEPKASQPMSIMMSNGLSAASKVPESSQLRCYNTEAGAETSYLLDSEGCYSHNQLVMEVDVLSRTFERIRGIMPTLKASREADRLSRLLEQCAILQDEIDEKLRIYF
ncbi:hypothetical protein Dimus_029225 [Dionaea muscipula]